MKKFIIASLTFVMLSTGCNSNTWDVTSDLAVDKEDPTTGLTPLAEQEGNDYAPLYWSVYGALRQQEKDGSFPNIFTEEDWDKAIDYVATNLKPYGYDMLVTDGFASMSGDNGYMTRYSRTKKDENSSEVELITIIAKLKAKGLKLGVYDSPFWLHYTNPDAVIPGTDGIKVGSLRYNPSIDTDVLHPTKNDQFGWVVTSHPGAEQFFEGFFKHYSDLGVKYIRMDFLSWYEDGMNYTDQIDKGYGRERYVKGMQWINKYAKKYGIYVSLVMPHLKNNAIMEKYAGNMIRIDADALEGSWYRFSDNNRGTLRGGWPNSENAFDGFINWSRISGHKKIRLDGDFIRIGSFANDDEKQAVVSLPLMAGGPISVTDMPTGHDLTFFQNTEMLALQKEGFVGQPLARNYWNTDGEIWYGQMKDGSWVVGLFNRAQQPAIRTLELSKIGLSGTWNARNLWTHVDEGQVTDKVEAEIPSHGCKIIKLTKAN
ncbi:putative lipoprotein [Segatella baroniae F0067]|uniref:Putative lipoprotein n=1 Tax=Segatella baroniae F0067 TaxID=1115809 RepID=U2P832_9BACT|nr:lipoprotein [Segatella baroniae]ERK39864.1 putative lipoprotein [Segatella baroniae F0067]